MVQPHLNMVFLPKDFQEFFSCAYVHKANVLYKNTFYRHIIHLALDDMVKYSYHKWATSGLPQPKN